ncbi:MAG: FkbM family methyltransferase, partial [Pseudomonadota bacterium]|nr:FkbM family methyltransferase [Pseudomonadota bacterium]
LLIEGDAQRYAKLKSDYAAHPQQGEGRVQIVNRFVAETGADSLDSILTEHGLPTNVDLVCIDVDGQDFHIWRGLQKFAPRLVVVEYNPTIPLHIELIGDGKGNNVGCSALALARLGREKGALRG